MKQKAALVAAVIVVSLPSISKADSCSSLNYCQVTRRTWVQPSGWKELYSKDLKLDKLCLSDKNKHELLMEPTLAMSVSIASGDPKAATEVEKNPGVLLHIYTPPSNSVVGNSISPLDSKTIDIHKRLGTGGMIQVKCGIK